jgi:hypothetical protein
MTVRRPDTTDAECERVHEPPRRTLRGLVVFLSLPVVAGLAVLTAAAPWLVAAAGGALVTFVGGYRRLAGLDGDALTITELVCEGVDAVVSVFTV